MRRVKHLISGNLFAGMLAIAALAAFATPASAIDARKLSRDLLPAKAVVSAPTGAAGICAQYDWACGQSGNVRALDASSLNLVSKINSKANRQIRPISDQDQWAISEQWSLPTSRGGDCEDYALYKKMLLVQAGFSPDQLLLATVLDRKSQPHAVLVLRTGSKDLVLDNLTGRIKDWRDTGYTFLRVQNAANPAQWVSVFAGGIFNVAS